MLSLGSSLPTPNLTGVRFCYAQTAIRGLFVGANIYDAQFVNCQNGLSIGGAQFVVGNALFANTLTNIIFAQDGNASANIQNSTFSQSTYLATSPTSSQGITLALTNCIVANVTNTLSGSFLSASGNYNGSYSSGYYPYLPITLYCTQYPFQPVGAGYYYLTNGCGFQNVGTTNIFTNLLSQLPLKTTHAPALLTNAIAAGTVIGPNINVVRDNSATLDLGYHYDPLDYCTGNLYVDNDLTLTNGVAIGFYGSSGFASVPTLISSGTAKNMNELVLYPSVQEEPIPWGTRSSYNYFINNTPNTLQFSFTDISMAGLSGEYFFDDYGTACNASFNNCQFLAAKIEPSYASYQATMGFTNNLFQRCFLDFSTCGSAYYVNIVNNLFLEGTLTFGLCDNSYAFYQDVVVENNLFVTNIFSYTSYLGYGPRVIAYNGYYEMTALNGSAPSGSGPAVSGYNVTITNLDFQIGPLGNYYYPSSGTNLFTLVGNGSTTANVLGLYYFTTQTNQIIQGDSPVDIGYHYVATDTNGNPLATFGDGIPDYVDDPNGNGLPNWWELEYFGNTSENATNVDQQGNTLYYDYTNGLSPSGMPDLHTILLSSFSILTNQASKTWTYNPNQPDLATNQLTWTWPANLSCVGYGTVLGYSEVLLTRQEVLHISHSIANNERCQFLDTNGVSWIGVVTQAVNVVGDMEIYQLSNSAPPSIQLPYVLPPDYTNYVRGHSIVGFPCIWPHKNQSQLQAESIEGYVIQNLYNGTGDTLIVTNTGVPPFGSGTNLFATGGDSGGPHFLMFSNTPVILFALTSAFTNLAGVCFCDGYFVSGNATNWIYLCAGGYTNGMNMLNLSGYQKYQH